MLFCPAALTLAVALGPDAGSRAYQGPTSVGNAAPQQAPEAEPEPAPRPVLPRPPASKPEYGADDGADVREVRVGRDAPGPAATDRAGSRVSRADMDERLPRSAPDALRYEPGVYVQQTAHAQASPYVRGLTGQQTVMFFDGVRLNNSTFRQGPNQYFFTVDSRTLQSLEVVRGASSTRFGADAIGGALLSSPIEPNLQESRRGVATHGRVMTRTATADGQYGGRAQMSIAAKGKFGVIGGVGYRDVGQLRSGGPVTEPATGEPQKVPPTFEADGKTQRGTGFRELTADTRMVWEPVPNKHRLTLGYYDYRQHDAPRTDKCPPPTAPQDECLTYNEQFRTLVYLAYERANGPAAAEQLRATVSYQRQHEDRTLDRGDPSTTRLDGVDDVNTVGSGVQIATKNVDVAPWAAIRARYGADNYFDWISSESDLFFEDTQIGTPLSRGQYLDGARYDTFGGWVQGEVTFAEMVRLRVGSRLAVAHANADEDLASESAAVDETWVTGVGGGGVAVDPVRWLTFAFNVDQGYRAPNLDDLTSRQQTGPGFQFENPDLRPERATTLEAGLAVNVPWLKLDAWVFRTYIRDLIGRVARAADECPAGDPGCTASQTRFQLANFEGHAILQGVEGSARVLLPAGVWLRATISAAKGDRPNPFAEVGEPATVPISRVPPLNGTGEVGWRSAFGLFTSGAVRWARVQDRLAPQDEADPRIPAGGTPGYGVVDIRAGYRLDPYMLFAVVFENVADTAWRSHGSSVNGPGRGLIVEAQFGF